MTAPPPGYLGEVPFGIGVVELPDGVRVITCLTESHPLRSPRDRPWSCASCLCTATDDGNDAATYAFGGMTGVNVAGVGLHPFGRFDGVSTTDMGVVAVRAALDEAGIGKGDFQAAFCGTAYGGVVMGYKASAAWA